jgi:hypothetical protein
VTVLPSSDIGLPQTCNARNRTVLAEAETESECVGGTRMESERVKGQLFGQTPTSRHLGPGSTPMAIISRPSAGMLIAEHPGMETVLNIALRSLVSHAAVAIKVSAESPTLTSPLRRTLGPSSFDY